MPAREIAFATALAALLTACSGGGGSKDLSAYAAVWQGACDGRALETMSLRPTGAAGTLELQFATEHHDLPSCTGAVVATLTVGPAATATFAGEGVGRVRGPRPGETVEVVFDRFTVVAPAQAPSMVGPTVREVVGPQGRQWCFDHAGGTTCIVNPGARPASTSELDLLLGEAQLWRLVPGAGVYERGPPYTRR